VFVVCCVVSVLSDKLISRSDECYRVCVCLKECDLETSTVRRPRVEMDCCPYKEKKNIIFFKRVLLSPFWKKCLFIPMVSLPAVFTTRAALKAKCDFKPAAFVW